MVQAFPEGHYGWHLGKNGSQHMHTHSVGIEVCNFGYIKNGKTYAGTSVHESQLVKLDKPFKGFDVWHRYSDEQIESLRLWLLYIADRDGIDVRKGLVEEIKSKGADGFCDPNNKSIVVDENTSFGYQVKTLVHELSLIHI